MQGRRRTDGSDGGGRKLKYHLVRGHFGPKEYERPYRCSRDTCLRVHWTVGTGPAKELTANWVPSWGGSPLPKIKSPLPKTPRVWLLASRQMAELLTDLVKHSDTFVEGLANAFSLDDSARDAARQIETWPQMKELLDRQGVLGINAPVQRRELFWGIIQRLIDQEARDIEREEAADLRKRISGARHPNGADKGGLRHE